MTAQPSREPAARPEDLGRFFLERANAGDVEGLVALYEPDAVLAFPPGRIAAGHGEIREVYRDFLASRPVLSSAGPRPPLRNRDPALPPPPPPGGPPTRESARPPPG